ncbi:restriction endonuclease subunit S [Thioalkalivibrio versutus]|uniref:restriction endonuclease subunit S n=1 Tax=Thioalkalivibrio versutus TaxID=106634 RepID=UPI00069A6C2E|nr:restriction endonuclease subunit S [Thioalkalivibrio versutus]
MSWRTEALGDLFLVGSSKRVLKSQWQTSGVPFYRGREVTKLATNGCVDNELFISEELYADFEKRFGVPKAGDIVITAIGTIGNAYIVQPHDRFYFKDASVLWLSKKREVESRFVNYWLQSPRFRSQLDKANGATVDTLTVKKLKSVQIDFPPLPEQKRIVVILDEAFAGIDTAVANTEKNLDNARELFESYLDSVFQAERPGWDRTTLGDLYEIGSSKRVHKKDWRENGVPFYRAREIVKLAENGAVDNELFISERRFQEYGEKTGVPQTDDLMVTAVGTLGICYVVQPADRFYFKDASVLWFRPKRAINANFIQYAFRSPLVERQTTDSQGATVGTLTISRAKTISISIPYLELQEKIAKSLREVELEVDRLSAVQRRKLVALRELKESLLQKAFSGELPAGKAASDAMRQVEEIA